MRCEQIGDATLYRADCREVLPVLERIDSVVTDPPYGMSYQSGYRKLRHDPIEGDGDAELLKYAFGIPASHSRYVFCRWTDIPYADQPRSVIVWEKNCCGMGDLEHEHGRTTEVALFWPGESHKWPYKRPWDVVRHARVPSDIHPTAKPVSLMEEFVSWTAGVVVDPFMGSGTTGVACANLRREFIGIETNQKYFDIACQRIDAVNRQERLF